MNWAKSRRGEALPQGVLVLKIWTTLFVSREWTLERDCLDLNPRSATYLGDI